MKMPVNIVIMPDQKNHVCTPNTISFNYNLSLSFLLIVESNEGAAAQLLFYMHAVSESTIESSHTTHKIKNFARYVLISC